MKKIDLGDIRNLRQKNPELLNHLFESSDLDNPIFHSREFQAAMKDARSNISDFSKLSDFLAEKPKVDPAKKYIVDFAQIACDVKRSLKAKKPKTAHQINHTNADEAYARAAALSRISKDRETLAIFLRRQIAKIHTGLCKEAIGSKEFHRIVEDVCYALEFGERPSTLKSVQYK